MLPKLVTLKVNSNTLMPTIHVLDSIKIDVYSREHLPAHFHALYAEHEILIVIKTQRTYAGYLPIRQHKMVLHWTKNEQVRLFLIENFKRLNPNLNV